MKTKVPTLSEATRVVYRRRYNGGGSANNFLIAMKHNLEAIGNLPVNKITKQHMKQMMDYHQIKRKNSKPVINTKLGYMKIVLEEMIEDGFLKEADFPKRFQSKKRKVHYLTENMEKELLDYFITHGEFEGRDIVKCLIDLGCRISELLSLEKRFVDYENNQIIFNERKNDTPVGVPMTNKVRDILKPYYERSGDFDTFFSGDYFWMNGIWERARKFLGHKDKKYYVIHLCRHTCASRLVQRGVELLIVKDWLGHEDIQTTMIYAHLAPKALHSVVEVLN
tara:strand:- start:551 stop:1390 length:840 start_codon:yes stop_codon:yes gene_type:complete